MRNPNRRPIAVLKLPRRILNLIGFAQHLVQSMTNNPRFPNPNPLLAQVSTATADLVQAQEAAKSRTVGAVQVRDEKAEVLIVLLKQLLRSVQNAADANPAEAEATILSAGMQIKRLSLHAKQDFEVKPGRVSGECFLIAKRIAKGAAYEWQYSVDQKSWSTLPTTTKAKTAVGSLNPGTTYFFHFRSVTKAGEGDWSQIIAFMVK